MDLAFSILRDFYHLSDADIAGLEPAEFVKRLRGIHRGFNTEHEFAAIASWLGRCKLVTHPDEVYATDGDFRVPDFLIVSQVKDREMVFLVEVKTTDSDELVWSEKYLASLRRFADLLRMPLLIGWKRYGLWTLCDSAQFVLANTAFHLSFDCACKNNLMTALFGNVFITVKEGFRLEMIYELLDATEVETDLLPEGQYMAQVADAALYTYKGRVSGALTSELFPIFLAKMDVPRTERDGKFLHHIYPVDPEGMFNLSDLLFTNLTWHEDDDNEIDWIAEIRKGLPKNATDLHAVLRQALDVGAVQYIIEQQPAVIPAFLKGVL